MATYTRRETYTHRVEFTVPTYPHGAAYVEVVKAINAAQNEISAAGKDPLTDDAIRISPGDDCVIISYVVQEGLVSSA